MRKFKLLPAIFTLVLCVGTLAIGVFALAPTQNTITGTISINSVNTPVEITMNILNKAGGNSIGTPKTIRGGDTFTLGDLAFDTADANEVYDVKDIFIEFRIKNLAEATTFAEKQAGTLGAFFAKNTVNLGDDQLATSADIFTYEAIKNASNETAVNVYADSYTPILPGETVKIELQLRMETFEELVNSPINYKLYIEKYVAETTVGGLVKLPVKEGISKMGKTIFDDTNATHIAIPATYNTGTAGAPDSVFSCVAETLVGVNLPSSLTDFYQIALTDCTNLKKVVVPVIVKDAYPFYFIDCTNLTSVTLSRGNAKLWDDMFSGCSSLNKINFDGTIEQWNSLELVDNDSLDNLVVYGGKLRVFCTDGVVVIQTVAPAED